MLLYCSYITSSESGKTLPSKGMVDNLGKFEQKIIINIDQKCCGII